MGITAFRYNSNVGWMVEEYVELGLERKIIFWHRSLAQITGAMSYRMVKHMASRSEMLEWAVELRRVAKELEDEANHSR